MPRIAQEQTNWCWAACTEMVLHYYGNPDARQCEFANSLFNQTQCCEDPTDPACNQTCTGNDVEAVYANWNIRSTLIKGTVPFDGLQAEIDAGRPVEVAFKWTGGGAHVAIVRGWETNEMGPFVHVNDPAPAADHLRNETDPFVHVNDPAPASAADHLNTVSYEELLNASGRGRWILTWTGIQR